MQKFTAMLPDALIVTGATALSYGAWLLHPSAGFLTAGVLLVTGGVVAGRKKEAK
jgi:hypothetical protein